MRAIVPRVHYQHTLNKPPEAVIRGIYGPSLCGYMHVLTFRHIQDQRCSETEIAPGPAT